MKFNAIVATALLIGSTALLAQESQDGETRGAQATLASAAQTEDTAATAEDTAHGEEVVCRRERVTGSRVRTREICMTRNEWAELEARTRDGLNRMGSNASGGAQCRMDQQGGC